MKFKPFAQEPKSLPDLIDDYERALIIDALVNTGGNQSKAAKLLGITKRVIHYKVHKYGIDPRRFRMNGSVGA
jgi:Nif-specific regulatory protein